MSLRHRWNFEGLVHNWKYDSSWKHVRADYSQRILASAFCTYACLNQLWMAIF